MIALGQHAPRRRSPSCRLLGQPAASSHLVRSADELGLVGEDPRRLLPDLRVDGKIPVATVAEFSPAPSQVATALVENLVAALPRRGVASIPELVLRLTDTSAGRFLVATPRGSGLVVFAWPVGTRSDVAVGANALRARWPCEVRWSEARAPAARVR